MMKKLIITTIMVLFLVGLVYAETPDNQLHLNIQVLDGDDDPLEGTFDFHFNLSTNSACSSAVYNISFNSKSTDSRGIVDFYLTNTGVADFKQKMWLCYARDGVMQNISEIARISYAETASTLLNESNLSLPNFNITADVGYFNGIFSSGLAVFRNLFNQQLNTTNNVTFDSLNLNGAGLSFKRTSTIVSSISDANIIISANGTGSVYLNWRSGFGGVNFVNGTTKVVALLNQSGTLQLDQTLEVDGAGDSYFTGNVGIGTTAPTGILTINTTGSGMLEFHADGGNPAIASRIGFRESSAGAYNFNLVHDGSANKLVFNTSTVNNVLVIDSGGNVGIGTSTPGQPLNVIGDTNITGQLRVGDGTGSTSGTLHIQRGIEAGTEAAIGFRNGTSLMWKIGIENNPAEVLDDFVIISANNQDPPPFMIERATGNIGIGTTTPTQELDVSGDINISLGHLIITDGTNFDSGDIITETRNLAFMIGDGSNSGFYDFDCATTTTGDCYIRVGRGNDASREFYFQIYNGTTLNTQLRSNGNSYLNAYQGNVGIGTVTPSDTLNVQGTLNVSSAGYGGLYVNGSGSVGIGNGSVNSRLSIIDNGDNSGISIPAYEGGLLVQQASVSAGGYSAIKLASFGTLSISNIDGSYIQSIGNGNNDIDMAFGEFGSGDVTNEYMRIANGGNVGIGTTKPTHVLNVVGNSNFTGSLNITKSIFMGANLQPFTFSSGSQGLAINPNVNVGRIQMSGNLFADIIITARDESSNLRSIVLRTDEGRTRFYSINNVGSTISDNIIVMNHSNGNVGIGTATSSNRLEVDGTTKITDNTNITDNANLTIQGGALIGGRKIFSAYTSLASVTFTTANVSVGWGENREDSDYFTHGFLSSDITVLKSGDYWVEYQMTTDVSSGSARSVSKCSVHIDGAHERGMDSFMYNRLAGNGRNTGSAKMILSLTAGEDISVVCGRVSGTDTLVTVADAGRIAIEYVGEGNQL